MYCKNCGTLNQNNINYCKKCGEKISTDFNNSVSVADIEDNRKSINLFRKFEYSTMFKAVALVAVLVIGYLIFSNTNTHNTTINNTNINNTGAQKSDSIVNNNSSSTSSTSTTSNGGSGGVSNSGSSNSANAAAAATSEYYRQKAADLQNKIREQNEEHLRRVQEDLNRAEKQRRDSFAKSFAY